MSCRSLVLLCAAVLVSPGAARAADAPDLVIRLPQTPAADQVAPVYVDRFEEPGRVLYRFDAVIRNEGGTLDVFRSGVGQPATQALWAGGTPPPGNEPDAGSAPAPGPNVTLVDRSAAGASFFYVVEPDHEHWHFSQIARYELLVPGAPARVSEKIGFCFFDGFDTGGVVTYFPEPDWSSSDPNWCRFGEPGADIVRMGLSPGASDRYRSQRHWQWVDVTGLVPGSYVLRGRANPLGYVVESDASNNVVDQSRVVPGSTAVPATAATAPARSVDVPLSGTVVAPEVPARSSAACEPDPEVADCYVWAPVDGPLTFGLASRPRHGSVTITPAGARAATARYTPAAGFRGEDRFTYTTTDVRGLVSAPAAVTVSVRSPAASPPVPLARVLRVRRRGGRWYVVVRVSSACTVRGTLRRGGRVVRRLGPTRLAPGRHRIGLGRLRRAGRYAVRLRVRGNTGVETLRVRLRRQA